MKNYALVIEQGDSLIVTIPDEFVRQHMLVRGDHLKRTIDGKRIILEVQDD
jgi:antitoxin component of MazEF toxin-antitoxin module